MATPPQLQRVHGFQPLLDLDSPVNVRLPLFDAPAGAVAAVAADVLPRLAGAHRSRQERDAPAVFDLLAGPREGGLGVGAPSFVQILAAARAALPYTGPIDASSPIAAPRGTGPNGTPMTVGREPVDMQHPMPPAPEAIQVLQAATAAMPVTPPRGAAGRIHLDVAYVQNRTVPNPDLR
ncbi:MAG: hypothetical protein NTX49_06510 [Chlamydiae bacterium]|nr:hypothetical protein [Chlamydiota bacterium]